MSTVDVGMEFLRRTEEHRVQLRSELFFGREWTDSASYDERVSRWNDLLRHEWEIKGGQGPHPLEEDVTGL